MNLSFSQRMGLTKVRDAFQITEMDNPLRTAIWNHMDINVFHHRKMGKDGYYMTTNDDFISLVATEFFHMRYIAISSYRNADSYIDKYYKYCMEANWYNVYDFLEYIISQLSQYTYHGKELSEQEKSMSVINKILEEHMAGYRYISGKLSPITDEVEISSIELAVSSACENVKIHLHTALAYLSDRQSPNYRNSIKESISAVEAVCRVLTGKSTLGEALKAIERTDNFEFNAQFKTGLEKMYAYANDKDTGIRHALIEDAAEIKFEDAKFMLILCCAFVNYIPAKKQN